MNGIKHVETMFVVLDTVPAITKSLSSLIKVPPATCDVNTALLGYESQFSYSSVCEPCWDILYLAYAFERYLLWRKQPKSDILKITYTQIPFKVFNSSHVHCNWIDVMYS